MILANDLNDTLSYLDSIEQLLLLTSISFSKLPTASFNNRVIFTEENLFVQETFFEIF
jgi:hypothetical protein